MLHLLDSRMPRHHLPHGEAGRQNRLQIHHARRQRIQDLLISQKHRILDRRGLCRLLADQLQMHPTNLMHRDLVDPPLILRLMTISKARMQVEQGHLEEACHTFTLARLAVRLLGMHHNGTHRRNGLQVQALNTDYLTLGIGRWKAKSPVRS